MQIDVIQIGIWSFFFASSVYGHVAFKLAARQPSLMGGLFSLWGMTAVFSWGLSAVLWLLILSKSTLLTANTISSLSYGFIILASLVFFKEPVEAKQILGVALVSLGIYLVTR
jgi:drug/metabolite transporter (DMT)-like permease